MYFSSASVLLAHLHLRMSHQNGILKLSTIALMLQFSWYNTCLDSGWIWFKNPSFQVGTKIDLREDRETLAMLAEQGQSPMKREQGLKLASKIRAVKYLECSALTQRGLKQVGIRSIITSLNDCLVIACGFSPDLGVWWSCAIRHPTRTTETSPTEVYLFVENIFTNSIWCQRSC